MPLGTPPLGCKPKTFPQPSDLLPLAAPYRLLHHPIGDLVHILSGLALCGSGGLRFGRRTLGCRFRVFHSSSLAYGLSRSKHENGENISN
jgi:hypothetical protein